MGRALIDKDGAVHEMAGLLDLVTSYANRKMHLGYRQAELHVSIPGYEPGCRLRGHEFHYCTVTHQGDQPLAQVSDAGANPVAETGSRSGNCTGTFFHLIGSAT